jgi:hypothetical protein
MISIQFGYNEPKGYHCEAVEVELWKVFVAVRTEKCSGCKG